MDTTELGLVTVNNLLEHHGIKGMRWGVRSTADTGARIRIQPRRRDVFKGGKGNARRVIGSRIGAELLNDYKYGTLSKTIIHNKSVKAINKELGQMNSSTRVKKYTMGYMIGGHYGHPMNKRYSADVQKVIQKHYQKTVNDTLGKKYKNHDFKVVHVKSRFPVGKGTSYAITVHPKSGVKHDAMMDPENVLDTLHIQYITNQQGHIVGVQIIDDESNEDNTDVQQSAMMIGEKLVNNMLKV